MRIGSMSRLCLQSSAGVQEDKPKKKLTPEEAKARAAELQARAKMRREQEEKVSEKERERARIAMGKEMNAAIRAEEEQKMKRLAAEREREKAEAAAARVKIREKLEADRWGRRLASAWRAFRHSAGCGTIVLFCKPTAVNCSGFGGRVAGVSAGTRLRQLPRPSGGSSAPD